MSNMVAPTFHLMNCMIFSSESIWYGQLFLMKVQMWVTGNGRVRIGSTSPVFMEDRC